MKYCLFTRQLVFPCLITCSRISSLIHGSESKRVSGLESPATLAYTVVNVVDKDHRVNAYAVENTAMCDYISRMNHQQSNEKCQAMTNCLYHCLPIDWHYAVGPDENNRPSMYDLTTWKKSRHWKSRKRVWHCNQRMWRNLNANKTNLIIGSIAWNHTLANLILTASIPRQPLCNLLLKLFSPRLFPFVCEVQPNTSQRPARSFTQDHYGWKRSEWLSEK